MAAAPTTPHVDDLQASTSLWRILTPICFVVLLELLAMGLPLPVLPLHVQGSLGLGSFGIGLAIGAQSWVTLATRHAAGTRSDRRGPRSTAILGLGISAVAGAFYVLSLPLPTRGGR